jgi:dihydroflavonol-4-reductase
LPYAYFTNIIYILILVTGANGFLGEHLIKQLLADSATQIIALYRSKISTFFTENKYANVQWMHCDILDVDALDAIMQLGITHVYHCANSISFDARQADDMMHNNVEGTATIANACLEYGVQKLLYVSSVAAIARAEGKALISEKTPWLLDKHTSQYGISKYKAEMEVWRAAAEGLPVVIVNPSVILGEGDWHKGSSQLFKNVWNEFAYYTRGTNGFVDVQDVCTAMMHLMHSQIVGERYIINQGNYSYLQLFTNMAKHFGKKPPYKYASPWLSGLVWRLYAIVKIFTGKTPLITQETAYTANQIFEYDNSKLLNALPAFKYQDFGESLRRICGWYCKEAEK